MVVKGSKVADAPGAEVFQVDGGEAVGVDGSGWFGGLDCVDDLSVSEGSEGGIQRD